MKIVVFIIVLGTNEDESVKNTLLVKRKLSNILEV